MSTRAILRVNDPPPVQTLFAVGESQFASINQENQMPEQKKNGSKSNGGRQDANAKGSGSGKQASGQKSSGKKK